jgi:acetylornithine/N-succinyldiaminopimelate aminotransferase
MSASEQFIATGRKLLINNYGRAPIVMSRGEGCVLWDSDGNRYLDMTAGIAVCVLGHGHKGLAQAIANQAGRLHHTSNLYYIEMQIQLAEALARRAESNEAALKLARRYQAVVRGQPERVELIAFENSFHGRTMGSLSVTGRASYRQGFGPLIPDVKFIPFADLEAARSAITDKTCAVIAEPIQGEGGINLPPPGYLQELRRLCTDRGALLIFDEVQTGVGRTGTFYAYELEAMVPDIITLSKGLAGGVPMGAMIASLEVERAFEPGTHAATFGGNPLACAAALYIQHAIDEMDLLARCRDTGAHLGASLLRLAQRRRPKTRTARGRGLLQGLVLEGEAGPVVERARSRGLLLTVAGGSVVRFAPPLVVSKGEIDEAVAILDEVLAES